ncbi:MAG: GDYXXLXY domain-containing protein [Methylococcales bacterium]
MHRQFIVLAIIAQLAVLGYMVGKREVILATGQQIYLQTAPIDPRDPFRGDYVRLTYPFNTVDAKQLRVSEKDKLNEKGYPVYAVMKQSENNLYILDYLTDQQPQSQIYIKGRINKRRWGRGASAVNVKYGLEQLFVEQGKGREIERIRGNRGGIQVPMEVQVAIGGDGTAVLRDYQWSKLGMQFEILRFNQRNRRNNSNTDQNQPTPPLSPKVKVTLKNVSDAALVIVDPGNHCGFKLVPVASWSSATYTPLDITCKQVTISKQSLKILEPDQAYQVELDLSKPRWHMRIKNRKGDISKGEIGIDDNNPMFRIVYQSPRSERLSQLPLAQSIWSGQMSSRAFNVRGRID